MGDGSLAGSSAPVAVSGITDVTAITAGARHSCALLAGGTIKRWVFNQFGQLGDGSTADRSIPVTVTGLAGFTAVAAGEQYSCVPLASGGTVKCWGSNEF